MTHSTSSPWARAGLRDKGDEELDEPMAEFVRAERAASPYHTMQLLRSGERPGSDAFGELVNYTRSGPELPNWVDRSLLRQGREVFRENGLVIVNTMFNGSMPLEFSAAGGVRALYLATAMRRDTDMAKRRLAETAMFLITVMGYLKDQPGESRERHCLEAGQTGYLAVRDVRLYHAAARAHIAASGQWDDESLGVPINLQDIYGTLLASSIFVVDSLRKLGIVLSDDQVASYLHRWSVVGWLIGLEATDLLPLDEKEARAHADQLFGEESDSTAEGVELTRILIEQLDLASSRFMQGYAPALMRQLLPADTANMLGVPAAGWRGHALAIQTWLLSSLPQRVGSAFTRWLSQGPGRRQILRFIDEGSDGKSMSWDLGVLRKHWRLD